MRKINILLPVILFAVVLFLVACSGSPSISIEPTELDLGNIPPADPVEATVRIRNDGAGMLEIADLRTSCGCTTATVEAESLTAGAETDLTVIFDPLAHEGLYGPLMRIIFIQSNDPNEPTVEIPMVVNVLSPEEVSQ